MTIDATPPLIDYVENGVTLAHPIPFQFTDATEIRCERITGGVLGPALTLGVDYAVAGGGGGTGSVTKTAAGAVGTVFRIQRQTTRAQPSDYLAHDNFPAEVTEQSLDRLAAVNLEQDRDTMLLALSTLRVPYGETVAPLSKASLRASTFLHFSATGAPELLSAALVAANLSPALTILMGMSFKGDPGSPGEGYPTRAAMALAGNDAANLDDVYLTEGRRGGKFVFYTAAGYNAVFARTLTADVAADPQQGLFVATQADATGAGGAWVRQFTGPKIPQWFGAVGGGLVDDYTALQAWLDSGGWLLLPRGLYRVSQTLKVRRHCQIRGEGFGFDARLPSWSAMPGSVIYPDANVDAWYFMNQAVIDDTNTVNSNTALYFVQEGSIWSECSDIGVVGNGGVSNRGYYIRTAVHFRNCHAIEMPGKGFDISASADITDAGSEYGNADTSVFDHCRSVSCGDHGFHLRGRDANVIKLDTCNAIFCGGWAFLIDSEFACKLVNCHAAINTLGSYKATSAVASHVFDTCYVEGGVGERCYIGDPNVVIGGSLAGQARIANDYPAVGGLCAVFSNWSQLRQLKFLGSGVAPTFPLTDHGFAWHDPVSGLVDAGLGSAADRAFMNKNGEVAADIPTGTKDWNVGGDYYRAGVKVVGAAMGPIANVATTISLAAASPPTKAEFDSLVNAYNDLGVKFNALLVGFRQSTGHGLVVG